VATSDLGRIAAVVYEELRHLAAARMARIGRPHLAATALVHEAWMRLVGTGTGPGKTAPISSRGAEAMRRILIESAGTSRA